MGGRGIHREGAAAYTGRPFPAGAYFGLTRDCTMVTYRNINDYDIQALVDNELDWEQQKLVLNAIETNPAVSKRYDELCAQKKILQHWWNDTNRH